MRQVTPARIAKWNSFGFDAATKADFDDAAEHGRVFAAGTGLPVEAPGDDQNGEMTWFMTIYVPRLRPVRER